VREVQGMAGQVTPTPAGPGLAAPWRDDRRATRPQGVLPSSLDLAVRWFLPEVSRSILLPIKTWHLGTEYTVADIKGGQP